MRKFILVFAVFFTLSVLKAQICDLGWNDPIFTSNNTLSFLEKNCSVNEIFGYELQKTPIQASEFNFSLSSLRNFRHSLINFFSVKDQSNFLYYRTPDKTPEFPPESSYIYPSNKPVGSMLKFNIFAGLDHSHIDNKSYSFLYYGTKLTGFISKRLFFYGYWWSGHFIGNISSAEDSFLIDSWTQYSDNKKELYLDNVIGGLTYRGKGDFWTVSIGRDKYEIGSNIGGSIILNNDCNDYGYLSTKFVFDKLYVSYIHASLIPDSTRFSTDKSFPEKYIAIHKFGWKPNNSFELFLGEEIVYANRSLDLNYLLPQTFWRGIEHNLSDRDNALIFWGMNLQLGSNYLIYSNFILDEMKKSEIFSNWWGNKYAFQVGSSFTFDQENNGMLSLEFTAIRPWLYTHNILENKFSHYDISLGFPKGSNLIQYTAEFNFNILKNLNINANIYYTRQGSVGNSFNMNYNSRPSNKADWLEGEISDTFSFTPVITWEVIAHHRIKAGISLDMELLKHQEDEKNTEFYLSYQAIY